MTSKWNVYNIKERRTVDIFFDDVDTRIGSVTAFETTGIYDVWVPNKKITNPPKVKAVNLTLVNGNGTFELTLNNLRYKDSGKIILRVLAFFTSEGGANYTLNVEGKQIFYLLIE